MCIRYVCTSAYRHFTQMGMWYDISYAAPPLLAYRLFDGVIVNLCMSVDSPPPKIVAGGVKLQCGCCSGGPMLCPRPSYTFIKGSGGIKQQVDREVNLPRRWVRPVLYFPTKECQIKTNYQHLVSGSRMRSTFQ